MNIGKTLFAQVMEYVPWKNFGGIINRYEGDAGVRTGRALRAEGRVARVALAAALGHMLGTEHALNPMPQISGD